MESDINPTIPNPSPEDSYNARRSARLDLNSAAELAGRSRLTMRRQEAGICPVDLAIYRLFLSVAGWAIDPSWNGWSFGQGKLWSPEGDGYQQGEIRQLIFLYQLLSAREKTIRELSVEIDRLKEWST